MSSYQHCSRLETSEFRPDLKRITGYFMANDVQRVARVEVAEEIDEYQSNSDDDDDDDNESFNLNVADESTFSTNSLNVASLSLNKLSGTKAWFFISLSSNNGVKM